VWLGRGAGRLEVPVRRYCNKMAAHEVRQYNSRIWYTLLTQRAGMTGKFTATYDVQNRMTTYAPASGGTKFCPIHQTADRHS